MCHYRNVWLMLPYSDTLLYMFCCYFIAIPGSKPAKQMAAVLFEYRPEQPDELELMEGDEVEIVKMVSILFS